MSFLFKIVKLFCLSSITLALSISQSYAKETITVDKVKIAVKQTKRFEYKEGFERAKKNIINTLKDNEVTRFQTLLEGLDQAYDLDEILKNNGYYTIFAPSDKAFKKIPSEDQQRLFADKKRLRQVLSYHIVKGKVNLDKLRKSPSVKSIEGRAIKITNRFGNIFMENAFLSTADVRCTNGIVHVIDNVILPEMNK